MLPTIKRNRVQRATALIVGVIIAGVVPSLDAAPAIAQATAAGRWSAAPSLGAPLAGHAATLLDAPQCSNTPPPVHCGKVLVAGGRTDDGTSTATSAVFDDSTMRWSATGSLTAPRAGHALALLSDGRLLATGGVGANATVEATAELFEPTTTGSSGPGVWAPTGRMATSRANHTATSLLDGRVLVVGGRADGGEPLSEAELFDASINFVGGFATVEPMVIARSHHTATLLPGGRLLVAGGTDQAGASLRSTEVYDPANDAWAAGPDLGSAHTHHTATSLLDGRVLVTGDGSAEIFDPSLNQGAGGWVQVAPPNERRSDHAAALLKSGAVLVSGGTGDQGTVLGTAEVFDPVTGRWQLVGQLITARTAHTATTLSSGKVLAAGGEAHGGILRSVEVFDPAATQQAPSVVDVSPSAGPLRGGTSVTLRGTGFLGTTSVLFGNQPAPTFDVVADSQLTATTPPAPQSGPVEVTVTTPVATSAATDLSTFHYLVPPTVTDVSPNAGATGGGTSVVVTGLGIGVPEATVSFGDKAASKVEVTSPQTLAVTAPVHTAGVVDVTVTTPGGVSEPSSLSRFTFGDGQWEGTSPLGTARYLHTSTLLPDGSVLVAGGTQNFTRSAGSALDSAEIYDPSTRVWRDAGRLNVGRFAHTATTLADGRVLVAGGAAFDDVVLGAADAVLTSGEPVIGPGVSKGNSVSHIRGLNRSAGPALRVALSSTPPAGSVAKTGDAIEYSLAYFNSGSAPGDGTITFTLPPEVDYESATIGGTYDAITRTVAFPRRSVPADTRADRPSGTVSVTTSVRSTLVDPEVPIPLGAKINAVARIDGSESNTASLAFLAQVSPQADLRVSQTAEPPAGAVLLPGDQVTYSLAYFNAGSTEDASVVIKELPREVEFVSASDGATFDASTNTVTFPRVVLPPGSTAAEPAGSFTVTGGVIPSGRFDITGIRSAEIYDPAHPEQGWVLTGSLERGRFSHTATLLDGPDCHVDVPPAHCARVLVTGGTDAENGRPPVEAAELYDPSTGAWMMPNSGQNCAEAGVRCGRGGHTASLLPDGRVLLAGGLGFGPPELAAKDVGIELDPKVNSEESTGGSHVFAGSRYPMPNVHLVASADPPDGSTIGPKERLHYRINYFNTGAVDAEDAVVASELPDELEFISGSKGARYDATDRRVRFPPVTVRSGTSLSSPAGTLDVEVRVRERIPDFKLGGTKPVGHRTPLPTKLLVSGSDLQSPQCDPAKPGTASWCLATSDISHVLALYREPGASLYAATTADPALGASVSEGDTITYSISYFNTGKAPATGAGIAVALPANLAFVNASHGGRYDSGSSTVVFPRLPVREATTRVRPAGTLTVVAQVVTTAQALNTAEVYDPATGAWTSTGPMSVPRYAHSANVLDPGVCGEACGTVLVAGGVLRLTQNDAQFTSTAEIYDATSGNWEPTASMRNARAGHSSVVLPNGKVLVAGNSMLFPAAGPPAATAASEVYDPLTRQWLDTSPMLSARGLHSATLLAGSACQTNEPPDWCDTVLVAGGTGSMLHASSGPAAPAPVPIPEAELYSLPTLPPSARGISPSEGPSSGGTKVEIEGSEFARVSSVTFDGIPASSFRVASRTRLEAVAPPHPSGLVEVLVTTAGGTSPRAAVSRFTYHVSRPPAKVVDLSAGSVSTSETSLTFPAVASDAEFGPPAATYIIRQATTPIINDEQFATVPVLCGGQCVFAPAAIGQRLSLNITGLAPGTSYHYAIKAVNDIGQVGPLSDSVATATFDAASGALPPEAARQVDGSPEPGTSLFVSSPATPSGDGQSGSAASATANEGDDGSGQSTTSETVAPRRRGDAPSGQIDRGANARPWWQTALMWLATVAVLGAIGFGLNRWLRRPKSPGWVRG